MIYTFCRIDYTTCPTLRHRLHFALERRGANILLLWVAWRVWTCAQVVDDCHKNCHLIVSLPCCGSYILYVNSPNTSDITTDESLTHNSLRSLLPPGVHRTSVVYVRHTSGARSHSGPHGLLLNHDQL